MARPLLESSALRKPLEVYLADAERRTIQTKASAAGLPLSGFVRKAALGHPVATLPQPNAEKWQELARLSANVNQLAKAANSGDRVVVDAGLLYEVAVLIRSLRLDLIGVQVEET